MAVALLTVFLLKNSIQNKFLLIIIASVLIGSVILLIAVLISLSEALNEILFRLNLIQFFILVIPIFIPPTLILYTVFYFLYKKTHKEFSYWKNTFFLGLLVLLGTLIILTVFHAFMLFSAIKGRFCAFSFSTLKNECLINRALRENNLEICNTLPKPFLRDKCYAGLAVKRKDASICSLISNSPNSEYSVGGCEDVVEHGF